MECIMKDINSTVYVKNKPIVTDDGIYMPVNEYSQEGTQSAYRCVMTKEQFVEAYNKWIVEAQNGKAN